MLNDGKVVPVEFRKERVGQAQRRVVDAQVFLQDLAPAMHRVEALACCRCATIIPPQIEARLLAFEDRGDGVCARPAGRHIRAVTAARKTDFQGARGVALRLSPEESEPLQLQVRRRLGGALRQLFVHSASSRAQ